MLHPQNSRWSKVEQVERKSSLKPAPPPPPSRREVVGGAVEQGRKSKVEQNGSGATDQPPRVRSHEQFHFNEGE